MNLETQEKHLKIYIEQNDIVQTTKFQFAINSITYNIFYEFTDKKGNYYVQVYNTETKISRFYKNPLTII